MSAASRLLSAQLRAADPGALRRLTRALKGAGGSVSGACEQLGMPVSTLYDLRRDVEAVRDVLQAHAMGRSGAQARATNATRRPKIESASQGMRGRALALSSRRERRLTVLRRAVADALL